MIKKMPKGFMVYSHDGKKHLGGPYKTEGEAARRLMAVEAFKAKSKKKIQDEREIKYD